MPSEMEEATGAILSIVAFVILMIFGIPGNCLILRVYWVKQRKTSTHILILGLAWTDLFSCILLACRIASFAVFLQGGKREEPVLSFFQYLLKTAVASSVTLTAVIAFDRYDCVCRPHRRLLSPKRAKIAFCCSVLYGAAINIPYITDTNGISATTLLVTFAFQILCYGTAVTMIVICYSKVYRTVRQHVQVGVWSTTTHGRPQSDTRYNDSSKSERAEPSGGDDVKVISESYSVGSVPKVTISGNIRPPRPSCSSADLQVPKQNLEIATHDRVCWQDRDGTRRASRRPTFHKSPSRMSTLQRKTTRMLLLTSIVFLILWLPYWVYVILKIVNMYSSLKVSRTVFVVFLRVNALLYLNNAINPLLYGLANRRFRQDCNDVLKKLK